MSSEHGHQGELCRFDALFCRKLDEGLEPLDKLRALSR